jgi:hypothetical protein
MVKKHTLMIVIVADKVQQTKKKKDERCRRTPGWNEVPFAIYYVLNNRHNEIN